MKKFYVKICLIILMLCSIYIVMGMNNVNAAGESGEEKNYSWYVNEDNEVLIYIQSADDSKELIIPETINGYKVVSVSVEPIIIDKVESIKLPDTVEEIKMFARFTNLKNITFPKNLKKIIGLNGAGFESLVFPEGIEIIKGFNKCKNLKKVKFPKSAKTIQGFDNCDNLKDIQIQEGTKFIFGFDNTACTELVVPSSVLLFQITNNDKFFGVKNNRKVYFCGKNTNIVCLERTGFGDGGSTLGRTPLMNKVVDIDKWGNETYAIDKSYLTTYDDAGYASWMIDVTAAGEDIYLKKIENIDMKQLDKMCWTEEQQKKLALENTKIYCYEDSIPAILKTFGYNNVNYITNENEIPKIEVSESNDNKPTEQEPTITPPEKEPEQKPTETSPEKEPEKQETIEEEKKPAKLPTAGANCTIVVLISILSGASIILFKKIKKV